MSRSLFSGVTAQAKSAKHRLDDARSLFRESRWRGAMYMAGYGVECLLKAKLMKRYDCRTLLELEDELHSRKLLSDKLTIFTHQLSLLLNLTGSVDVLRRDRRLWPQFVLANSWLPAWRYNPDLGNKEDAEDYLSAATTMVKWVENNI
jgi:HEPN domain-containing protein